MVPDQRMLQHAQSCGTATLLPRAAQLLCARCSRQLHSVSAVASLEPVRASRLPQETAPRPNSAQRTSGQDRQQTITQSEGFLAGQHTSFTSIGLSREVASALDAAGFKRPSGVQVPLDSADLPCFAYNFSDPLEHKLSAWCISPQGPAVCWMNNDLCRSWQRLP